MAAIKRLKGRQSVTFSSRAAVPKLHLDPECEGLERTPEEARTTEEFSTTFRLAKNPQSRPCRMCTLASVLRTVCDKQLRRNDDRVIVSFTSQASPDRVDGDVWRDEYQKATESGAERLRLLAEAMNWQTVNTLAGPAAVAELSRSAAEVVAANLRCVTLPVAKLDEVSTRRLEAFWTLSSDNPHEQRADGERGTAVARLWEMAGYLTR